MHSVVSLTVVAALLAAVPGARGHGNIMEPAAVWQKGYPQTGYGQTLDNLLWGPVDNAKFGYGPEGAVKYFEANFPTSGYKSLQDLILAKQTVLTEYSADAKCGLTVKDEAKRAELPSTVVHSGFFHPGPCELWCDNTKLAYALDCSKTYASNKIPIDTSKCAGADRLTLYWVAVHGAPWQVYTDCVYLKGGKGGSSTPAASDSDTPTVTTVKPATPAATTKPATPAATTKPATPAATTKPATPAATTKPVTPVTTPAPPALTTKAPVASDSDAPAPKPAAPAPAPAGKNCKRRNRQ